MSSIRIVHSGEHLFHEEDAPDAIYIIRRGAISIRKEKVSPHAKQSDIESIEIAKITAGEVIGELSFFDRKPRSASAVAITESEVLEITFHELELIYNTIPDYLRKIVESLASRLRQANEQIANFKKKLN